VWAMKINSNSIRSAINEFQQDAKATEAAKVTKEVLPETKNLQAAEQLATGIKSEQTYTAIMQANELKSQLSKVDVAIKEVLSEIEKVEDQQKAEQDRIKNQQEQQQRLSTNVEKAADSYTSILDSIKLDS
jgi:predicted  nucleic acid-binding Zn-ribbon protein